MKPVNNVKEDTNIQMDWDFRDNYENKYDDNTSLGQLLKLPLICMAINGCFTYDLRVFKKEHRRQTSRRYQMVGLFYRVVCLLACIAWCAKCLVSFFTLPSKLIPFNIIVSLWCLQVLLTFIIYLRSHHNIHGGQRKSFNFWDAEIRPLIADLEIKVPVDKIRKRTFIYLVIAGSCCVANLTGIALLGSDAFEKEFGIYYCSPFSKSVTATFVSLSIAVPMILVCVMTVYYVVCVCNILIITFDTLNGYIADVIPKKSKFLTSQFYKIRLLQLSLSEMVSDLDRDFRYHFAVSFVLNMGISSYVLYLLLRTTMSTFNIVIFLIWAVGLLSSVGIISVFAALVSEAVSRHFSLLNVKFAGACGYDFVCDGRRLVRAYLRRRRGAI